MGILNVTPDSFYDGGRFFRDEAQLLRQVESMLTEGATFIDIGGYSSRPGAAEVTEEEEKRRVVQTVAAVAKRFPEALLSVDTFRASVAREAVAAGAKMVNDITGGAGDEAMLRTVGELLVPYVLMHMRGTPQTMQTLTKYDDLVVELIDDFQQRLNALQAHRVRDVIIDPGFGFAKTIDQNFTLLSHLDAFRALGVPILAGLSRKSTIYRTLGVGPEEALNGTTVLNTVALLKGASILRVHDVREAVEAIQLMQHIV
ncbi:MAG: dihydropteroate synthase [Tunicatimonas sp.]